MPRLIRAPLLLLACAALVLLLLLPKAISFAVTEQALDSLIELMPQGNGLRLEVGEKTLTRGWFTSRGTLMLSYSVADLEPVDLNLDFDIHHGPLLSTGEGLKIGLAYAQVKPSLLLNALLDDSTAAPLTIDADVSVFADLNQTLFLDIGVKPLQESGSSSSISLGRSTAQIKLNKDQSADATFTLGDFTLSDAQSNQQIEINGLSLQAKTARLNSASAESMMELQIPLIRSNLPNPVTVENVSLATQITKRPISGQLSLKQSATVGNISGDLQLHSAHWQVELSDINEESLTQFYAILTRIQALSQDTSPAAIRETSELNQRLGLLLINSALALESTFTIDAYAGQHSGTLAFRYLGLPQLKNLLGLDLRQAIAASSLNVELDLDYDSVSQSPAMEMLDPFVKDGFLVIDNNRITMTASLKDSVLELNGDATPVDQFF